MAPVQRPGPQVRALTLTALDALHAENRAAAARIRACRELFALCEDEQFDRAVAAGYGAGLDERPSYAIIDPLQMASAEIVAAYGVHHHRARKLIRLANDLCLRFPALLKAMESGVLDEETAEMLAGHMRLIDSATLERIQREVADWLLDAINSGRRPGRDAILDEADRITRKYDPEGVLARRERAREERNVWLRRGRDGMSDLNARLSAPDAQAIFEALGTIAGEQKRKNPGGPSKGQLRADALVDALLGPSDTAAAPDSAPAPASRPSPFPDSATEPASASDAEPASEPASATPTAPGMAEAAGPRLASIRPNITVLAPLDADGEPEVYLPRGGTASVDALIALLSRSIGATITVPDTAPGAADSEHLDRRYRLSPELARRIRLRDGTCRHPGCSVPASDCDIDHCRPFDHSDPGGGGLSIEANLMCLCRQHHRFKTFHGWDYHLAPDGTLTVTTDTGHTITTDPAGPLARWRQTVAAAAESPPESPTGSPPHPRRRPWLSPRPQATHQHRRERDLEAEREANTIARYTPPLPQPDHDPPPF